MAISQYYVNPAIAGNSGTGIIGDPYGDLQYALNTLTRNSTDGDQINIKAGTDEVNAAALTLATYGAPTAEAPLILRGYTSAANDGGIGVINCGGFSMWTVGTYDFIILAELEMHTFGDNNGVNLDDNCLIWRCTIHKGASTPTSKVLLYVDATSAVVACNVYNCGNDGKHIRIGANSSASFNYLNALAATNATGLYASGANAMVLNNIVNCGHTGQVGVLFDSSGWCHAIGNTIYNSTAGTAQGIYCGNFDGRYGGIVINNVLVGFSGAGGKGIQADDNLWLVGYNAFYNNTTPISVADQKFIDLTAHDITLVASPFSNAAGGDFSVSAALKALGFPATLGPTTNTYIDIGAAQRQEAGGGGMLAANKRGNKQ